MSIINFLRELKHSYHLNGKIYTEGSCFRLYTMLKALFPQAKPYYSYIDGGHWITEIDEKFYDINGEITLEYVQHKEYELITNKITLASAYVPTYGGHCSSYSKYKKSV